MNGSVRAAFAALVIILLLSCSEETPDGTAPVDDGAPVIVISVDTLRSDRLPMYGYDVIETPALDALRRDSILFERAYSPVPLTLPAHSSILTGTDPDVHGVRSNVGYRLSQTLPSIPRILATAGYETGAAVSAWVLRSETGVGELFDFYDDEVGAATGISFASVQRSGDETAEIAADWIRGRAGRPLFFMLHLFEPHTPYEPPAEIAARVSDPYDGEIVATDRIVGRFLDELRDAGIYDDAMIVFLSDHGEGLGDHGEPGHGIFLYREAIQVPLLVKLPRSVRSGESIPEPVSLIDLAPTILGFAGLDLPEGLTGRSLLGQIEPGREIYGESLYPRLHLGWSELRSIVRGELHYIEAPEPELYDLADDPDEASNVLTDRRRDYASLRESLDGRDLALANPSSVDPEEAAKLAALGYLGSIAEEGNVELPDPKRKIGELQQLIEAMNLASSGDRERAIAAFRKLLERNPSLVEGWLQLGRLLEEEGRLEDSLNAYQTAMRLAPTASAETALSVAEILLRLERFEEARRHAELGEKVNLPRAIVIRARIALAEGNLDEAATLARSVPDGVEKEDADVLLANVLTQAGRLEEAMGIVDATGRRSLAQSGRPPEGLLFVRGDILARMNRLDEAIDSFDKEIELYPGNLQAYASLAVVSVLKGDRGRARDMMSRMVNANPSDRARRFAAHTLEQLGDSAGAARYR